MAHVRDKNAHPTITLAQLAFLSSVPPSDSQGLWSEILGDPGTRLPKHLHLDWSPCPAMEVHVLVDTGVHVCACVCVVIHGAGAGVETPVGASCLPPSASVLLGRKQRKREGTLLSPTQGA